MKRVLLLGCALAAAAGLAACGSASDNLNFKVPAGFTSKTSLLGFMQMWTKGNGDNPSLIILTRIPVKMDLNSKDFQSPDLSSYTGVKKGNAKLESLSRITICGNQPAILTKMNAADTNNKKEMEMQTLLTVINNATYAAVYMYPETQKVDPAAEDALKTVCAKS
jgi:hypothetical protein